MVFFPHLCVNLQIGLCGDRQAAPAQTHGAPDMGRKSSFSNRRSDCIHQIDSESKPSGAAPLLLLFCALLVGSVFLLGCRDQKTTDEAGGREAPEVAVSVVPIHPAPLRDILNLPGETEPHLDVRVASDAAGRVEALLFREGDAVAEGELLARIDVAARKAALDRAKAAYQLAESVYDRRRKLFDRRIITQEELDYSIAEQTRAEADLDQARVEYQDGFVHAPISGRVNHLHVDQGEFINRGDPLLDLVNIEQIEIIASVPESDVRYLRVGQTVKVRIDALPGKEFLGRIDFIAFKADPATKTFRAKILMDNPTLEIRPGMIARLDFLRRVIPDALSVPLFAVVDRSGERLVFVVEDGVAHARSTEIGVIEGDRVQIVRGLEPGDQLIVKGQRNVEEGTRVRIQ